MIHNLMGRAYKIKVNVLDSRDKARQLVKAFTDYIEKYADLERKKARIPFWRHFKLMKNLRERERLTREYKIFLSELGVFE